MQKVIFLDRDGVVNKEIGYLHKIKDFKFIDGVIDALIRIQNKGFKIIIITNQSGIGRGLYTIEDFHELNNWMINYLKSKKINILEVFFCPHLPEDNCKCRKPKPGLYKDAIRKFNINVNSSYSVGDKETDIIAAKSAGIKTTILVRSGHKIDENNSKADHIFNSLIDVSKIFI